MNSSEVVKLNKQVIDTWNDHDTNKFLDLCDDKIVWTINKGSESYTGKNEVKDYFNHWKTAFPDLSLKIKNQIAGDNQIAVEYEFTGNHKGSLKTKGDMPDISPTMKKIDTYGCYIAKIENGKVVELNNYPDRLGLMSQLGIISDMHKESA